MEICEKCGGNLVMAEYLDGEDENNFDSCLMCMDCGEFYPENKEE